MSQKRIEKRCICCVFTCAVHTPATSGNSSAASICGWPEQHNWRHVDAGIPVHSVTSCLHPHFRAPVKPPPDAFGCCHRLPLPAGDQCISVFFSPSHCPCRLCVRRTWHYSKRRRDSRCASNACVCEDNSMVSLFRARASAQAAGAHTRLQRLEAKRASASAPRVRLPLPHWQFNSASQCTCPNVQLQAGGRYSYRSCLTTFALWL